MFNNKTIRLLSFSVVLVLSISIRGNAEDIELTTFYPSPRAMYMELRSTSNTYLATQGLPAVLGIGTDNTVFTDASGFLMGVAGGISVGANYATNNVAPANGVIVEGNLSVGAANASAQNRLAVGTNGSKGLMRIGSAFSPATHLNTNFVSSRLGVGTTSPIAPLHAAVNELVLADPMSGSAANQGVVFSDQTSGNSWIYSPEKLEIAGAYHHFRGSPVEVVLGSVSSNPAASGNLFSAGSTLFSNSGYVSVGTNPPSGGKLRVSGDMAITGYYRCGQTDVAENFTWATGQARLPEPGDVVSISTNHDIAITLSSDAYDTSVVGVIATEPGVLLGAETEHGYPVALAGRIPVKVTNEGGNIERGDFLVASSKPGYAMKANSHKIQQGMVLGKALENFTEDSGYVLMLVQ